MRSNRLLDLLAATAVLTMAHPARAAASTDVCAATATVSGNSFAIVLDADPAGLPRKGSSISYQPAGTRSELYIVVNSAWGHDKKVSAPFDVLVGGLFDPNSRSGSFSLKLGTQTFKSEREDVSIPPGVLPRSPSFPGREAGFAHLDLKAPLITGLAEGGGGELSYRDESGRVIATANLAFMTKATIQEVIDKAYPATLELAKNKGSC